MHHLPGLEGWANPGLQNNHLLMPVCFPMLQQGYHPGINVRRERTFIKNQFPWAVIFCIPLAVIFELWEERKESLLKQLLVFHPEPKT